MQMHPLQNARTEQELDEILDSAFEELQQENPIHILKEALEKTKKMFKSGDLKIRCFDRMIKTLDDPLKVLDAQYTPAETEEFKALLVEGHILMGLSFCSKAFKKLKVLGPEKYELSRSIQMHAAQAAFYSGGWKKSPDAIALRGISQFVVFNLQDAVLDLSAALDSKLCTKWVKPLNLLDKLSEKNLENCRKGLVTKNKDLKPLYGEWLKLQTTTSKGRFASSYCQVEKFLYTFGGCTCVKDQHSKSMVVSNDLQFFNFESKSWELIIPADENIPPARAYAVLTYYKGFLWLAGGQTSNCVGMDFILQDVWCYNIALNKWREQKGNHPTIQLNAPNAVVNGHWWIVNFCQTSALVYSFNFKTRAWQHVNMEGPSPPFSVCKCSSWLIDSELFIWSPNNDRFWEVAIWKINLIHCQEEKRLKWEQDIVVGFGEDGIFRQQYSGSTGPVYEETAVAVDRENKKAYIFGGWDCHSDWVVVSQEGVPTFLSGRPSRALLEIDCAAKSIRTVESVAGGFGPKMRQSCVMGFDEGFVGIFGGYTTLDNYNEATKNQGVKALGDSWLCRIVPEEMVAKIDSLSPENMNSNVIQKAEINISELCKNAYAAVVHDIKLRKFLSELHPKGVKGSCAIAVWDHVQCRPLPITDMFSSAEFLGINDIFVRFPDFQAAAYAQDRQYILDTDPLISVSAFFHITFAILEQGTFQNTKTHFFSAKYGRFVDLPMAAPFIQALYVNEHDVKKGEFRPSTSS